MRVDVLTLFPERFRPCLDSVRNRQARERGHLEVHVHNICLLTSRDPSHTKPRSPEADGVISDAVVERSVEAVCPAPEHPGLVMVSPQGHHLDRSTADELLRHERLVVVCGRLDRSGKPAKARNATEFSSSRPDLQEGPTQEEAAMDVINVVAALLSETDES